MGVDMKESSLMERSQAGVEECMQMELYILGNFKWERNMDMERSNIQGLEIFGTRVNGR
jgi:hypothetical protein